MMFKYSGSVVLPSVWIRMTGRCSLKAVRLGEVRDRRFPPRLVWSALALDGKVRLRRSDR